MAKDRRSDTSVLNLAEHIPEALDPAGTLVISVRLPVPVVEAMDRARGDRTRSEYVRALIGARAALAAVSAETPEGHTRMNDGITPSEPTEWLEGFNAVSAETEDDT